MKNKIPLVIAAGLLASCATQPSPQVGRTGAAKSAASAAPSASYAISLEGYKRDAALRITQASPDKVFAGRPQALLRSVVVVKYTIDAQGNLVRTEIMRSNRDGATEATVMTALRGAAPFPKPASQLLRQGRVELIETWLFNDDGRFQLRTIAEPQKGE